MNLNRYLSSLTAASLAVGILMGSLLAVPHGAAFLFIGAALLCLIAFALLQRGLSALVALCAFFCLIGIVRPLLPPLHLLPESLMLHSADLAQSLLSRLHAAGLSPSADVLVTAMLFGNRQGLSTETLQLYRQTGASHILALSGLHLGILFGVINYCFLRLLNTRLRYVFGILSILLIWTYAFLVGFPVSLCRASIMMSLLLLSEMTFAGFLSWNLFGIAASLLLLINPHTLFDVGFQLSFGAIAGIFLFYLPVRNILRPHGKFFVWLWQAWAVSFSAQAFTLPLLFHYFGYFSLSGIVLSPVYILLATCIIMLALLLLLYAPLGIGPLVNPLVESCIALQHGLMSLVADVPWGMVRTSGLSWSAVFLVYFALFCLLTPLRSLAFSEGTPDYYRLAMFFRTWPYLTAALLLFTVSFVIG